MKTRGRNLKERICALLLAVIMPLTGILPSTAITADAAQGDNVTIEFTVNVENPTITVKDNEETGDPRVVTKDSISGKYEIDLTEGRTYTYIVSKTGYEDVKEIDFAPTTAMSSKTVNINMTTSAIAVDTSDSLMQTIGDSKTINVTNKIEGAVYSCASSDFAVVSITGDQSSGWKIEAKSSGTAEITFTNDKGSTSKSIHVTVNKKTLTGLGIVAVPNEGQNKNEITCSLAGLPGDATGTIKFTVGNESGTVNVGQSFTANVDGYFGGSLAITAEYSGDNTYNPANVSYQTGSFSKSVPLKLQDGEESKELTYGEENWDTPFAVPVDSSTVEGRALTYSTSSTDVAEVDANGQITPKHAGTAVITATAAAQNDYIATSVDYTVTVKAKELTSYDEFIWETDYSRAYNGETSIEITGTLKSDTDYKVTVEAALDSADAGEDKEYTIVSKEYEVASGSFKDYKLNTGSEEITGEIAATVTIEKRPVYVKADNSSATEIQYGRGLSELRAEVEGLDGLVVLAGTNGGIDENSGYIGQDKAEKLPAATFNSSFNSASCNVGDIVQGVIIPDIATGDAGDNYVFAFEDKDENARSLKFTEQILSDSDILKYIKVSSEGTDIDVRKTENVLSEIWVSKDAVLKLSIADEYQDFYDTVMVNGINATQDGITFEDYEDGIQEALLEGKVYLIKSGTISRTQGENEFNIVHVDTQSPVVTFNGLTNAGVVRTGLAAITFGLFKDQAYAETVEITDAAEADGEKTDGSGIESKKYYVWKFGSEIADDDLTEEAVRTKAGNITDWTEVPANNVIPVGIGETKEEVEGNYIVFVRTEDNVGNVDVYVSNGLVIEQDSPSITVDMEDKAYYGEEIPYTLTVDDATDRTFKSALSKIKVTVTCNGAETAGGQDGDTYKDSYTIDMKKETYSLQELADNSKIDINGLITEANNGNVVVITVDAIDNADNVATTWSKELKMDVKAPKMTVSYDNDSAKNTKYFKDPRTMTIVYTERNLNTDPDAKDICFDIEKDGMKYTDVTLNGLAELKIEWVDKKIEDSQPQPGTEEKDLTDERTHTLKLRFADDGEYVITPKCVDKAGHVGKLKYANEESEVNEQFVIDTTPPKITSVVYTTTDPEKTNFAPADSEALKDENNYQSYTRETVTAKVTIAEQNFWLGNQQFSEEEAQFDFSKTKESQVSDNKQAVDSSGYKDMAVKNSSYVTGTGETVLTFDPDANYKLGFTYTDLAGHTVAYDPVYFTVDATAPTGDILIDNEKRSTTDASVWERLWQVLTFNIFKNDTYDVSVTTDDVTAGVKSTSYYKTRTPISQSEVENLPDEKWTPGSQTQAGFQVEPDEQFVSYAKVVDKAGNVTFVYQTDGAVADKTEPKITVTNLSTARNGIYNTDVNFRVDVEERIAGDTFSGLKRVWYTIESTGNATAESGEIDLWNKSSDPVQREEYRTYTGTFSVDKDKFNSNDVRVNVYAEDFSGNIYRYDEYDKNPLKIDVTVPTIQVTYDLNTPANGKYYNQTRTATVTVFERNFDPNNVRFSITNTNGTQPTISGWRSDSNAGILDSAAHTCTVTFAADGDYTFTLNCTDLAGNNSNYTKVDEFTIDKTAPVITVTFDNNNAANGKYYNAARTATITVNEHNFNGSDVQTAITSNTVTPSVRGWSDGGDVHTATVPFTTDGNYSFTVNYTDLAGNPAEVYSVDEFVIDLTKPEIEIFDIEDKSANNGEVAPGVRYSDTNHDVNGVSITYSGPKHEVKEVDGARTAIPNGESIKMADFEHTQETDDVYTMVAKVTDLAGNSDEKQVTFSVNRFGSNFIFSDETEDFLKDYYNNEEENLVVTEINVDTLTHRGITSSHDGNMTDLEEGTDYTVKESGSEVSWKSYEYTIKKDNFEKEGLYNLTIDSVDRATNQVNNKIKEADIEFVIDKTAPTVVITGIEDDGQYRTDARDITVAAADNVAMSRVEVYVDDAREPVESYNANTIQRQNGELPYTITSSSDWQEVKAVAADMAGNVTDTSRPEGSDKEEWMSVLVTSNILVQFYRNTPLVIGTVIVVVGLAGIFFLILAKRRKKDEEE